jgi:hypothetical protein
LPIRVDAIAASLLRAPPATEVPTPVEHIATRRCKEAAKSSRASASWTLQSVCWRKRLCGLPIWQQAANLAMSVHWGVKRTSQMRAPKSGNDLDSDIGPLKKEGRPILWRASLLKIVSSQNGDETIP